jgi:hypothetical protein
MDVGDMIRVRVGGHRARRPISSAWTPGVIALLAVAALILAGELAVGLIAAHELQFIYGGRGNHPDLEAFTRFELPSIGRIHDVAGQPLVELADEYREITPYAEIPPVVLDAILAAEDKRFFSHDGVDYFSLPRVVGKVRLSALARRLCGSRSEVDPSAASRRRPAAAARDGDRGAHGEHGRQEA